MTAPAFEVDLRPLSTSELIDRGFSLYRQNFAGLLLIALLSQAAPLLVQVLTTTLHLMPSVEEAATAPAQAFARGAAFLVLAVISQVVVYGFFIVLTVYVADAYTGGVPSVKNGFGRLFGRMAGAVWTCMLNLGCYLLALVFPLLALLTVQAWYLLSAPASFGGFLLFGAVTLLLLVASLAPILVVVMRLMLTVPALALEGLAGLPACRRSSALVRFDPGLGFFYWGETRLSLLLLPLFIIQLLTSAITSVPMVLAQINEAVRHGARAQGALQSDFVVIGSQILTYFAGALIVPLYAVAVTLFYYDVRIRREGFDLEHLAGQLEKAAP